MTLSTPLTRALLLVGLVAVLGMQAADAQRARLQFDPELIISGDPELDISIFNFTPSDQIPQVYYRSRRAGPRRSASTSARACSRRSSGPTRPTWA